MSMNVTRPNGIGSKAFIVSQVLSGFAHGLSAKLEKHFIGLSTYVCGSFAVVVDNTIIQSKIELSIIKLKIN
jgi:hypothetical protein